MGVAAGGHREVLADRELLGLSVRPAGEQPGVVHLDRVGARELVAGDVCGDAVARLLEGMRDDGDAARLSDPVERLVEGEAARHQLVDAEREHVAGRGGHLHSDDTHEPVLGGQLGRLDARVDLVVVRDGERVEADRSRLL